MITRVAGLAETKYHPHEYFMPKFSYLIGAEVMVDGVKQAVTDQHGQYRLQSMTTGIYKISLRKEDFTFPTSTVRQLNYS